MILFSFYDGFPVIDVISYQKFCVFIKNIVDLTKAVNQLIKIYMKMQ